MDTQVLKKISYLVGNEKTIENMESIFVRKPFNDGSKRFFTELSSILMTDKRSKAYSDVVAFAFWIRSASIIQLENKYGFKDKNIHLGRGVAFHIAPSNVPVNFAYSLAAGILTGNGNIVRVPGRDFPQVGIIIDGIRKVLESYESMQPYIALIRYGHDKEINDALSSIADTRIIWGGDETIEEIRQSHLPPRSTEIAFADRYSLAMIDSGFYMSISNKKRVASDFYNDTYFSDQNACTSPRVVIWTGSRKNEAKKVFWSELYKVVEEKYRFQDIQGVNKLTSSCLVACGAYGAKVVKHDDNLLVRVSVEYVDSHLMDHMENSGYFYEYDCDNVMELKELCNDKRCQTVGVIGDKKWLMPLLESGIKGIDRIVNIGHTMDFDMIWDGYNLINAFTRTIMI